MRLFALLALTIGLASCTGETPDVTEDRADGLRIVSLAPGLTELAFQAGAGERIVAVVEYSDYPPAAQQLPRIGDAFRIDFERLRELNPDLVLVWESGNPKEMQRRLKELGYNTLTLETRNLDDVAAHIRLIGEHAGTADAANAAADAYTQRLAGLRVRYANLPARRAFFQISAEPWYTVNGEHFITQVMGLCGLSNVFSDVEGLAPNVAFESVLVTNPEVVIGPVADMKDTSWHVDWLKYPKITAVSRGQLVSVNRDYVSRAGVRLLDAAEQICAGVSEFTN